MTIQTEKFFAVAVPVIVALAMVAPGALAPAAGQAHGANGVQGTETDLRLDSTGSNVVVPGENVTATFTLTNTGDRASTAPVVELANVPSDWEVVAQSAGPNLTYSEANTAWVSAESLAPGEAANVSVTFELPNETAESVYRVSARAFDSGGSAATAVEEFSVGSFGDEPLSLTASGPESVRPGENVTMSLSLTNEGSNETAAPVVSLAGVPTGWTVLNHTEPADATYSETNAAWVSTESLAPGESLNVSVLLATDREAAEGPYFVSVSGFGETGEATAASARVNLTGDPVPVANETENATTTAEENATTEQETTTTAEAMTTTAAEETTTTVEEATTTAEAATAAETTTAAGATTAEQETTQNATANASATFRVEGEDDVTVSLEVADDPEERRQGLMFRESLPRNHGMVFVYDEAEPRSFWMKNTLIPLDMIFVAPNGTVLNVEHASVQPNATDEELRRYSSEGDAMYVVELRRGFANRTGVGPGTEVVFEGLNATETETTAAE